MRALPTFIEIFITRDGSPTLAHARDDGYVEKMHHSAGALSESLYIYHQALLELLQRPWPRQVVSVGLGLGYNEMIAVAELSEHPQPWKIWSFEAHPHLRQEFLDWIETDEPQSELGKIHDQVCFLVASKFSKTPAELKSRVRKALRQGNLEIRTTFPQDAVGVKDISLIFYDAYSRKMDPQLWTEDGVVSSFNVMLAPQAVFTTYAATGSLNRALKQLGFRLIPKAGFEGKRESTLAIRDSVR